jgi:catechol 2,3-dioxygenase-like lactoylglutathione lyase family enzyme
MSVTSLDHIYLETRSFERSLSFWRALGFSVAEEWDGDGHRACRLVSGSASVVLAETDPAGHPQRATVHFAVEDTETLAGRLDRAEEAQVVTPLESTHWGTRWIRVRDPEGNLYCLESPRD